MDPSRTYLNKLSYYRFVMNLFSNKEKSKFAFFNINLTLLNGRYYIIA